MERIMVEATGDCAKSNIEVRYEITEVSYCEFLTEYEPVLWGKTEELVATMAAKEVIAESSECDVHTQLTSAHRVPLTQVLGFPLQ